MLNNIFGKRNFMSIEDTIIYLLNINGRMKTIDILNDLIDMGKMSEDDNNKQHLILILHKLKEDDVIVRQLGKNGWYYTFSTKIVN